MSHNEVFNRLKKNFPFYADQTELWFPNGKNSIRLRMKNGQELIFNCDNSNRRIRLETVSSYLAEMKGAKS